MKIWMSLLLLVGAFLSTGFMLQQSTSSSSPVKTMLGCRVDDREKINKATFDSLISLPICAKDSASNYYKVLSFEFTYAERGLYFDSADLPIIVTDYSTVSCKGDTIPKRWIENFKQRSYKGDTIYFDRVIAKGPDQKNRLCKGLKVIIQ